MPYLYAQALEAAHKGIPLMRAMLLEFPDDPTCDYLDRQYMLGASLLVAPVLSHDGVVTYYLPAGRWTNFLTGKVVEGPGWVRETHDMKSLPLMVRPNSAIAVGSHEERPDYDYGDDVTLQVYEMADGKHAIAVIPSASGNVEVTFVVKREGRTITVEWHGVSKRWQLLLMGIEAIASVEGGAVESSAKGILVVPSHDTNLLKVSLGGAT
jgi:alpha-D-xyloside xylohydrolase